MGEARRRKSAALAAVPAGQVPALEAHEARDLALRQAGVRMERAFIEIAELAWASLEARDHQVYGFATALEYLSDRLKLRPRTVKRWLAVVEALHRLPQADRAEAREGLARIGGHKAGVIAPAIGRDGEDWREWLAQADTVPEEALQERVSDKLGLARRPSLDEPGARVYKFLMAQAPPELADELAEFFDVGFQLCESRNTWAVLAAAVAECLTEWRPRVGR